MRLAHALFSMLFPLACLGSLAAQSSKPQMQKQCESGDTGVCKSLSIAACDGLTTADSAPARAMCIRKARCYMNLANLPKTAFPLEAGVAQRCEEHYQGNLVTLEPPAIFVSWVPTTSATVDDLSPVLKSNLIAGAFPPGQQLSAGADPGEVSEYPYDRDNQVFLNVCQAHLKNAHSGHIATVPGKFLNKNCNVVFEGEFLVAHQFELAVVTSAGRGYWTPIPGSGDLQNVLKASPGPDGKAYAVCTAKISTDTSYMKNPLEAGVRWHGHHIGTLNSKNECVAEWGGMPTPSSTDVRVYFIGPPRDFVLPAQTAWYIDSPVAERSSLINPGSSK